jgi:branched-chain amino acid aminotransferase
MKNIVYAGGAFRPAEEAVVNVLDHGLLYGDGVFEGIRAYEGRVFMLERHVNRLFDSAKAIRLEIPLSRDEVAELVLESCRQNDIVNGYIRLLITRGRGDLGIDPRSCERPEVIVITRGATTLYPGRKPWTGVSVVTSTFRRNTPDTVSPAIKTLNYMNNILARLEASDRGADEALLLDREGYVAEATADNVFIATDQALVTPPTATNLRGITREVVLGIARELGIRSEERPFALFDLWTAREAFLCGTLAEIVPIASVDGRAIGSGVPGPATARIMAAFEQRVRSTGRAIYQSTAAYTTAAG